MRRLGLSTFALALLIWSTGMSAGAASEGDAPPDFKEVYELIRTRLVGVSQEELDRAAVAGLLAQLAPRVALVHAPAAEGSPEPLLSRVSVLDSQVGYVRVGRVAPGLAEALGGACRALLATNALKGLALDLRFAGGEDYAAAAAVADLFLAKPQPLLDWGKGLVQATAKTNALSLPVAVLMNRQTAGAAEALAGVLRETGVGLLLGSATAGQALLMEEFPLKNGQRLRVAVGTVRLSDGKSLPETGLKPDIEVAVTAAEEQAYWGDPFRVLPPSADGAAADVASSTNSDSSTNRPARRRLTEADLVREWRNGAGRDVEVTRAPAKATDSDSPVLRDPVLARAVDLIKGLALVRPRRPS